MEKMGRAASAEQLTDERVEKLDALYRAEYVGMVRLAFTLVGDSAEAEELVQDGFVDVYRRFDDVRNPGGYLRSAVVSRCRSALRRRRILAAAPPDPPADLADSAGELWDVLGRLSEDQRVAVVLRYYGRYRATEIAEILDLPSSTVRSHLRRGLATLRKELER